MSDVAVAEGDAGKGEIVVSPVVHDLLHNYTSQRPTPRRGDLNSGKSNTVPAPAPALGTHTHQHSLTCGCERTPSGYFKIRNSLEEMLCEVDFVAAPAASAPNDAQATNSQKARSALEAAEQQYEFDTYAQIVDELMAGFRSVSPHLKKAIAPVADRLRSELQADTVEPGELAVVLLFYNLLMFYLFWPIWGLQTVSLRETMQRKPLRPPAAQLAKHGASWRRWSSASARC